MRKSDQAQGFTLIEMAMVIAIIGFILGGGLLATGAVLERSRIMTTRQNMDQIESALTLFVIRNQRLPCPAFGNFAVATTDAGQEEPNGGGAACTAGASVVPWVALGLDESLSFDGWGRRISYGIGQGLGNAPSMQRTGTVYPPVPPATGLTVNNAAGAAVTPAADGAAYVLVSHGANGWLGWLRSGNPAPDSPNPNAAEDENADADAIFVQNAETANFDDVVRWRTPAFIIQQCGTGACGNP